MFTYLLPTSLMAMAVGGADGATEEIPMGIAFSRWNLIQFSACPLLCMRTGILWTTVNKFLPASLVWTLKGSE